MKVQGTFMRMQTLAQMTRAALKIWQFVARYTTTPLLCQGVDGDLALARNSRRVFFADAKSPAKKKKIGADMGAHVAFDDMSKLITPAETAALYVPPAPRVQVVALANWESAPTFVLDEHLGKGFPRASADRLLNKCNPFLSGKRRAQSDDDMASEAPTVSTDCSTIPENDDEELALDVVEEEVPIVDEQKPVALDEQAIDDEVKLPVVVAECEPSVVAAASELAINKPSQLTKRAARWVSVGYGRYVKCEAEQSPTACPVQKAEAAWKVRWVQVGHGRYEKFLVNGDTWAKAN